MNKFSKRHYEVVAEALRTACPGDVANEAWQNTISALSDAFKADNEAFSRDQFFRACLPVK